LLENAELFEAPLASGFVFCKEGVENVLKIASPVSSERGEGKKKVQWAMVPGNGGILLLHRIGSNFPAQY